MRERSIDGMLCLGPNFLAEFALIKCNLTRQKGLSALAELPAVAGNLPRLKIMYLLHAHR